MPPKKSALLTAGTTDPWEKKPNPISPMTTQGKILKAAAKKANLKKNIPREAPAAAKRKSSNPKPRALPPPDETAALALANAKRKLELGHKTNKNSKPLTTQGKIRAAEAMKKAMDAFGMADKEAADAKEKQRGGIGAAGTSKKAGKAAKPPGMMSVLRDHSSSTLRFAKDSVAVMSRRTRKAERVLNETRAKALADPNTKKLWLDQQVQNAIKAAKSDIQVLHNLFKKDKEGHLRKKIVRLVHLSVLPAPKGLEVIAVDLHGKKATFRFMDLPKELRIEIYRLVVVEHRVFVRPDTATGREQPDLAMVNKEVRDEVLPIFYSKNVVCVDLTGMRGTKGESSLQLAERWIKAVGSGAYFACIRNWIFDYDGPVFTPSDKADADQSLMLSVRFTKSQFGFWNAAVEIHRDASCIMPDFEEHGSCGVKLTPEWVNDQIIGVCDAAKGGDVSSEMISGLARALEPRMQELVEGRCEAVQVMKSIEVTS